MSESSNASLISAQIICINTLLHGLDVESQTSGTTSSKNWRSKAYSLFWLEQIQKGG